MKFAIIQLLVYYGSQGVADAPFSGSIITDQEHFVWYMEQREPLDPDEWHGKVVWSEDYEAILYISNEPGESVIINASLIMDMYGIAIPEIKPLFRGSQYAGDTNRRGAGVR